MDGVLGIDAAWTAKKPSGVALLKGSPRHWRCVAVTPSYDSFLAYAEGVAVDWTVKAKGAVPNARYLITAADKLLDGEELEVVTVDMPLSTEPIARRRAADAAISRAFGGKGASAYTPTAERPGTLGAQLGEEIVHAGFPLATCTTSPGTPRRLVEVYPHPALLSLTGATYRLCYKVDKSLTYWPGTTVWERKASLISQFRRIRTALSTEIDGITLELPDAASIATLSGLKPYEDALDALVCAWVGAKYLEDDAEPYGDYTAAIWVP